MHVQSLLCFALDSSFSAWLPGNGGKIGIWEEKFGFMLLES